LTKIHYDFCIAHLLSIAPFSIAPLLTLFAKYHCFFLHVTPVSLMLY
jgi:hypothetical protein